MTSQQILNSAQEGDITDIIFDFDETLCTLHIDWGRWSRYMMPLFERYENGPVHPLSHTGLNELTKKHGRAFRDEVIAANIVAERQFYHGYTTHDTVLELLRRLSRHARVHLWTSNCRETVEPVLEELSIRKLFTQTVYYNDVMYIKPDNHGLSCITASSYNPDQYLFIGDSASDEGAAQKSGIRFVHVDVL